MDPATVSTLVIAGVSFLVGHLQLIPKLLGKQPAPAVPPATVGHGELLKYLEQLFVNATASAPTTPTVPVTPGGQVDVNALLAQLVALLEKATIPPTPPVTPKV